MADYWEKRMLDAQKKWTDKDIDAINKQLLHYFRVASSSIIKEFEAVYDKVLAQAEEGKPITPADLYKLDRYYQMNAQLEKVLQNLGDKTSELLEKKFEQEYKHIYSSLATDEDGKTIKASISDKAFSTIADESAKQVANQIWCSDGKSWSQRIWKNLNNLQQTLNDGLIECVVTGKKTSELKKRLMERFNVTYNQAENLVRTEMAHIETQAALDRYKSSGTQKIRIIVDPDERTCDVCAKWDDKIVNISEAHTSKNCPPFHPRCRCAIAAVVEDKKEKAQEDIEKNGYKPLEMGAIDKAKLDRMIEREKITDNEVVFWKYTNYNGKVVYSTKKEEDLPYGYEYYDNVGWQKTYHYYRDANVLARTKTTDELNEEIRRKYIAPTKLPERRKEEYEWYYHLENENTDGEWENRGYEEIMHPQNTLYAQCIDCGRIFKKSNPSSNAAKRCPECQAKYRKKYKAQKEKERRAKKKNK